LERAWRVISENSRNSKSDEVKKEIEQFREDAPGKLRSLSSKLSGGSFIFPPAKGIPIPKKDARGRIDRSKFRPIVLASVESRIVQRSILDALLTVPDLQKYVRTTYSFGGIKKQAESELAAVPAAIKAVLRSIEAGALYVMCADISKFFTRIPKSVVEKIVAGAVSDEEFMRLFRSAISVELSNMVELRERADAFPIYDIGVAQGNSLSPLLGNILLYHFDAAMNEGDCRCIRYIDDIIILAPSRRAAQSRFRLAERILAKYDMSFGSEKSSTKAVSVEERFEFLGIELANGLIRPAPKAQSKLLENVAGKFDESRRNFRSIRDNKKAEKSKSLVSTLRRVDGIIQGWGKHYRFCNDVVAMKNLDSKISVMIREYIGEYARALESASDYKRRALLGVELLTEIERKPFVWPKNQGIEMRQV
jgi:retron-type reverse transcriptase